MRGTTHNLSDGGSGGLADPPPQPLRPGHVAAVAAGNALEFYDFLIYATFAVHIGHTFFPAGGPVMSLLLSLATFGIGFVTRPIGALVIGRFGDRVGRKPAMLVAFGLMGVGVLGMALTPSYASIGVAAPVLAVLFRLIQGFALGGEVGPTTAYLVEAAAPERKGLVGAMQGASQGLAMMAAGLVALVLSLMLPPEALATWGWRLAFLVGLLIVPFALVVRAALPETAPPRPRATAAAPAGPFPTRLVILSTVLLASGTINTYVSSYMTTYALDTLRMSPQAAFSVGALVGLCVLVFTPVGGWLSDRFGRRRVMIPATIVNALAVLPAYGLLVARPSLLTLYAATVAVGIPGALVTGTVLVAITESFPARVRCFAVGAIYATAIAVFGGTTQFMVAWLLHATGNPLMPAFYRLGATLCGLTAMLFMLETAPRHLRRGPLQEGVLPSAT